MRAHRALLGWWQVTAAPHGPARWMMDAGGDGYVVECACGEQTAPEPTLADAGVAMDEHLRDAGVHHYWRTVPVGDSADAGEDAPPWSEVGNA